MAEFCIHEKHGGMCEKTDTYCNLGACPYEDLKEYAPVKHGKWVHTDLAAHWYGKDECSECTYHENDRSDLSHFNYCPNCGAKMDGECDEE